MEKFWPYLEKFSGHLTGCSCSFFHLHKRSYLGNTLKCREHSHLLLLFGILGQIIFNSRFLYQWIYSERARKSTLPLGFWIISLVGSSFVFTYGALRADPVLISAHFFGGIIFIRNIYLIKKPAN